jgi:hypothetical protein
MLCYAGGERGKGWVVRPSVIGVMHREWTGLPAREERRETNGEQSDESRAVSFFLRLNLKLALD